MVVIKGSDHSTDPLLVKIKCDSGIDENDTNLRDGLVNEVKNSTGRKWWKQSDSHGLIRKRRGPDEPSTTLSLNLIANRKRLLIFLGLIGILIFINSMTISWNDDQQMDGISISHQSHVPGMKGARNVNQNETKFISQNLTVSPEALDGNYNLTIISSSNQQEKTQTFLYGGQNKETNFEYASTKSFISKAVPKSEEKANKIEEKLPITTLETTVKPIVQSTTMPKSKQRTTKTNEELPITEKPTEKKIENSIPQIFANTTSTAITTPTTTAATAPPIEPKKGFLVWSKECQIPDIDPFAPSIRRNFKKLAKPVCSNKPQLTDTSFDEKTAKTTLNFHKEFLSKYDNRSLSCTYKEIIRSGAGKSADRQFKFVGERNFNESVILNSTMQPILVNCYNSNKTSVYSNLHVLAPKMKTIDKRLEKWEDINIEENRPINVLLFGIDSVSRMNLLRTMPKTAKYVRENGWFEMRGYNKMGDNTFPNLMAVFTGYNVSRSYSECKPKTVGGLDKCPFVWNDYRNAGYVTAYAEDDQTISTFDYLKNGFKDSPTDYYLRPAMLAGEKHLKSKMLTSLKVCVGPKLYAEYIYDYALQIRRTYPKAPHFGVYWTNSVSHNSYKAPSAIDETVIEYFESFRKSGILNDTIVAFFSDHGMRFGELRLTSTGHLEERLPFFYIWLPMSFRKKHPQLVEALRINQHRLSTPYDFHITLKHILKLSGQKEVTLNTSDCPNSQSLFEPIPENRSCEDACIEDHWCTCRAFHHVDKNLKKVKVATNRAIEHINKIVKEAGPESDRCNPLVLKEIIYANQEVIPHQPTNSTIEGYQLSFKTNPGSAMFETTVRLDTISGNFTITGTISRLDSYAKQSKCVNIEALKKFCACKKK